MTLSVSRLSRDEINVWFERPFNPPALSDASSAEEFSKEYWNVHTSVCALLRSLGGVCDPIDGDFVMNDSRGDSRWLSIELITSVLANRSTVTNLFAHLRNLPHSYAVYISHEEPTEPLFHLIVTRDEIICTGPDTGWLGTLIANL